MSELDRANTRHSNVAIRGQHLFPRNEWFFRFSKRFAFSPITRHAYNNTLVFRQQ